MLGPSTEGTRSWAQTAPECCAERKASPAKTRTTTPAGVEPNLAPSSDDPTPADAANAPGRTNTACSKTRRITSLRLAQVHALFDTISPDGPTPTAQYPCANFCGKYKREQWQCAAAQEEIDVSPASHGAAWRSLSPTVTDISRPMGRPSAESTLGTSSDVATPRHLSPTPILSSVQPTHSSIFYPYGFDHQPPVLLHYMTVGGWRTVAGGWDYFSHRRLEKGEIAGHTVRWLHNAWPRDRFVFVIAPVENREQTTPETLWKRLRRFFFGTPPAFADHRGKSHFPCVPKEDCDVSTVSPLTLTAYSLQVLLQQKVGRTDADGLTFGEAKHRATLGMEVVEVKHEDITAADYSPRLLSSRFAIEAKVVNVYFFPTLEEVLEYYNCPGDQYLIEQQEQRGVASVVPSVGRSRCRTKRPLASRNRESPPRSHAMSSSLALSRNVSTASGLLGPSVTPKLDPPPVESSYLRDDCLPNGGWRRFSTENDFVRGSCSADTSAVSERGTGTQRLRTSTVLGDTYCAPNENGGQEQVRNRSPPHARALPQAARSIRSRLMPKLTGVHFDTIVTLYSEDPNFNAVLREVLMPEPGTHPYAASVKEQRRLLAMYELGMPSWTVFLASTGLPYRRALRLTFVGLVNIWPLISLFVGLYDLYKHLPQMKKFFSSTFEPLLNWLEEHFTVRVSMMVTYTVSVGVTIASALLSFLSQFYLLEVVFYPVRVVGYLLKFPAQFLFGSIFTFLSIVASFWSLLWITVKILFVGPFLLVAHLASMDIGLFGGGGSGAMVFPTAAEGTSLTMKWWRAWQEFWVTVAAPAKNLAKAWYDSIVHVCTTAARREASIRRWYTVKLHGAAQLTEGVHDVVNPPNIVIRGRFTVFIALFICLVGLLLWCVVQWWGACVMESVVGTIHFFSVNQGNTQVEHGNVNAVVPRAVIEESPLQVGMLGRTYVYACEVWQCFTGLLNHATVEWFLEPPALWLLPVAIVETLTHRM